MTVRVSVGVNAGDPTQPAPFEGIRGVLDWTIDAACLEFPPELFFPERGERALAAAAKAVCRGCEVVAECLDYADAIEAGALGTLVAYPAGVYGGLSPRQRARRRAALARQAERLLASQPPVGAVVARERAAWRVTAVEQIRVGHGAPSYVTTLHRLHGADLQPVRDRPERPRAVVKLAVPVDRVAAWWVYPRGRVPVASCCGDPWPCACITIDQEVGRLEQHLAAALPAVCAGCGEPITTGQRAVIMPGPFLVAPLEGSPTFHARRSCGPARADYVRDLLTGIYDTFGDGRPGRREED